MHLYVQLCAKRPTEKGTVFSFSVQSITSKLLPFRVINRLHMFKEAEDIRDPYSFVLRVVSRASKPVGILVTIWVAQTKVQNYIKEW